MDEKTKEIIKNKLMEWKKVPITQPKLVELKKEIIEKTGENKFISFANIKKWIKKVRKELASEKTQPKPTPVLERVYMQNISYEIAGIRRAMEKISQQLATIEKQLASEK